jgi:hypothetical protein
MAILIATFVFSCQSNGKNDPAPIKKYSEYTDLEKMNLKGEVIGVANYNISNCENCYYFTFYNEKGNIDKEFDNRANDFLMSRHYIYLSNILRNQINNQLFNNSKLSTGIDYLNYDSSFCLQSRTSYSSSDNKIRYTKYEYDKNGFPKEEITDDFKEKFYWNNGTLDSQILIADNQVFSKKVYIKNRLSQEIIFDENGNINDAMSYNYKYKLDGYGNDIKWIRTSFKGAIDSFERVIIYKGGDLTKYFNAYIELQRRMYQISGNQVGTPNNTDFETENNFQEQPQQKQWVNCKICHGTGLNVCSECGGKGIRECPNCHGRGFNYDAQHSTCNYCGGNGQVKCIQCYGKGNRGNCYSCGGRGQVQE